MRKLISLTLILFSSIFICFSQENVNNFQIDENGIFWQKVYESNLSFDQLIEKVKESGMIEKIDTSNNKITGDLKPLDADYKGAGYSNMNAPMLFTRSFITGFTIIEAKDGKYRLTIKRIIFTQNISDPFTKQGEKWTIESCYLKNDENVFKNMFKKSPSIILDHTFSKAFEFTEKGKSDNW